MKITTVGVCIISGIFPLLILPQLPGTLTLAFLTLFACVLAFIPVKTVRYIAHGLPPYYGYCNKYIANRNICQADSGKLFNGCVKEERSALYLFCCSACHGGGACWDLL